MRDNNQLIDFQDRILESIAVLLKTDHVLLYISQLDNAPDIFTYGFEENELKNSKNFLHLVQLTQESKEAITQINETALLDLLKDQNHFKLFAGIPILNHSNDFIGIISVLFKDINELSTEQKLQFEFFANQLSLLYENYEIKQNLKDKEFQLLNQFIESDDLYNNSPIGYASVDAKFNVVKANITFLDWLGVTKKKIIGQSFVDNFLTEDSKSIMMEFFKKVHSGINLNEVEIQMIGRSGKKRICLVSGRNYFDKETFIRLSFFDTTEKAMIKDLLDKENQKLITQNEIMNRDMEMAAKIQARLLPSHSLYSFIEYIYSPLEQIGGDFCDIFPLNDSIGIFISDVAGHGVPSAFVTAMLKSGIENASLDLKMNPGMLLSFLNESIIDFCAGRFVTAFYGIYNPSKREFIYSIAGHPSPYKIHLGKVENLDSSKSSRPLGIISQNSKLLKYKPYVNQSTQLDQGSRIMLCTDGLLEAARYENQTKVFFESVLTENLIEIAKLTIKEFLPALMYKMKEFIQDFEMEDDICMIVLDVK